MRIRWDKNWEGGANDCKVPLNGVNQVKTADIHSVPCSVLLYSVVKTKSFWEWHWVASQTLSSSDTYPAAMAVCLMQTTIYTASGCCIAFVCLPQVKAELVGTCQSQDFEMTLRRVENYSCYYKRCSFGWDFDDDVLCNALRWRRRSVALMSQLCSHNSAFLTVFSGVSLLFPPPPDFDWQIHWRTVKKWAQT